MLAFVPYTDIKALNNTGIPILTEEGKGYSLMDHYSIPPVMFTEAEANALITAEQLVLKNKDSSFIKEYTAATAKIKSVLSNSVKDKANLLSDRIGFRYNVKKEITSNYLVILQSALTNFYVTKIAYTDETQTKTERLIEPFALYHIHENWLLIAFCLLRKQYRSFRIDQLDVLDRTFEPHQITLLEYLKNLS